MKYSDYVMSKIEHMRRTGLVGPKKAGTGEGGGAAPDWVVERQKAELKLEKAKGWVCVAKGKWR